MNPAPIYVRNRAGEQQIEQYLKSCDLTFVPPLSTQVEIAEYARKISANAVRFEAWAEDSLIGLIAVYCNDVSRNLSFITTVSVAPDAQGAGIASRLMEQCLAFLRDHGFRFVELEVDRENNKALRLYERFGFIPDRSSGRSLHMVMDLDK